MTPTTGSGGRALASGRRQAPLSTHSNALAFPSQSFSLVLSITAVCQRVHLWAPSTHAAAVPLSLLNGTFHKCPHPSASHQNNYFITVAASCQVTFQLRSPTANCMSLGHTHTHIHYLFLVNVLRTNPGKLINSTAQNSCCGFHFRTGAQSRNSISNNHFPFPFFPSKAANLLIFKIQST